MKNIIVLFGFLVSASLFSLDLDPTKSAIRKDGESYKEIMSQFQDRAKITVLSQKTTFEDIDLTHITEWRDEEELQDHFEYVRDRKFLKSSYQPDLLRRSTWLYPDNGCFARAAMMINSLEKKDVKKPWKVFIFGDLKVETENSPKGYVKWWYHVVPIVKVEGEAYVFDPAIDHYEALTLEDWAMRQTDDLDSVSFSICGPNSYTPSSRCMSFEELNMKDVLGDQEEFLYPEWRRQLTLDLDPYEVLGENPPWI